MPRKRNLTAWKVGLVSSSLLAALFVAELMTRAWFAGFVGSDLWWYGTPWHRDEVADSMSTNARDLKLVQVHENAVEREDGEVAYSKYFPFEEKLVLGAGGLARFPVKINSRGFRGPDFEPTKPAGVRRVLAMGASSTFGYRNRDHETYPARLQQLLDARDPGGWEVINFAIPHASSAEILAMFRAEGAALAPDFVTVYAGANDSTVVRAPEGWWPALVETLGEHSVLALFLVHTFPVSASSEGFLWSDELAQEREEIFVGRMASLERAVRAVGGELVVVTQQVKSLLIPREDLRGVSYEDEVALVRSALVAGEVGPGSSDLPVFSDMEAVSKIYDWARILLIHDRITAAQIEWASRTGIPVADARAILDERRDLLLSWVHLHPKANRMVAATIADVLLKQVGGGAVAAESSSPAIP